MSNNNNKQQLDLTESLPVFDKAQATTTTPTVNKLDYEGISMVERRSRDVKPREKNDSLGISGINQPDVTKGNLSHSDEASTTTPIIDIITEVIQKPYYVDESDGPTIGFLLDCAKRGYMHRYKPPPSICKVSRILRDVSKSSYKPQLVSIGPIHREDKKLQKFESLKECYLNDLLCRFHNSSPKKTLKVFLLKVNDLLPKIRESYAGVKKNYSDVDLAKMMVMDGCFILEFCFKHNDEDEYLPNKMQTTRIAMDLMLLENQVPFSVLQALFDCSMGEVRFTLSDVLDKYLAPYIQLFRSDLWPEKKSILSHIKLFCSPEKNPTPEFPKTISTEDVDHVLGYLHKRYQLDVDKSLKDEERKENIVYHSIVELDRSGINFKPHQEDNWSMTIKFQSPLFRCLPWFWSKPTLLMPTLIIDDFTEVILRNFIAYEQSFPQGRHYFTSYVQAMHMLIDTQEDVAKLAESKVLINALGSNQEAADMINKIDRNIYVTDFDYTQEFKQVDEYYNGFWPKIKRTYFSNPWNVINLLAGIIVFIATVAPGIFAILDYFR